MGQEFTINSRAIEDRINTLLPSQGGFGAGVDFSASTTIIPIIDLTTTAEGSGFREDLQRAQSLISSTVFNLGGSTTETLIDTTGYWQILGFILNNGDSSVQVKLTDGTTTKIIYNVGGVASNVLGIPVDFMVFLPAGVSLTANTSSSSQFSGSFRQIADISGNFINAA